MYHGVDVNKVVSLVLTSVPEERLVSLLRICEEKHFDERKGKLEMKTSFHMTSKKKKEIYKFNKFANRSKCWNQG